MIRFVSVVALGAAFVLAAPASAQTSNTRASQSRNMQLNAMSEIPVCQRRLGTIAIVEPDNQWWRELNLGSPEAILKIFISRSGCFGLVNRGRSMQSRAMERAMADNGELQAGSNVGRGQVKTADYFLEPNIVTANRNSGGGGVGAGLGGAIGGLFGGSAGSVIGGLAGGISVKKGEANVTLSVVNARTTEEEALVEGYSRKKDVSWGAGGGAGWWGGFGAAGATGYQNTEIGQVIVLAYLDAYIKLVTQLGGLPSNAAQAAPQAR
ncbi:CsgG/HfaB family protein [Sphingomonas sp.]|uniref:CsgG/HfaB family protein n=1 Tax=Sphingomonas sp. TaxID=28214 RepID=UPI00286B0B3D|nr:CsgG/HfaB family protein [Sphingomonas sp.]